MAKNKRKQSQKRKRCKQVKNVAKSKEPLLLVKGMERNIFSHDHLISCCQSIDDDLGIIEEDNDQSFKVDSLRSEKGVFLVQESEDEDLRRLMNLEAKNKAQERIIEKLILENRYLKKLLQILEEKEYAFKEENSYLKKQLGKARNTEEELGNQLEEHISNCRNLKAKTSRNNQGNHHQDQKSENVTMKSMRNVRCYNCQKLGRTSEFQKKKDKSLQEIPVAEFSSSSIIFQV